MTCWEILEVPRDSDRLAIKKAYARLIKQFRPDESPEAFQKINAAYEEALHWLKFPEMTPDCDSENDGEGGCEASEGGVTDFAGMPEEFLPPDMTSETFRKIGEAIDNLPESEMIVEVDGFRLTRGETPDAGFAIERLFDPENDVCRERLSDEFRNELDRLLAVLDEVLKAEDTENPRHWDFLQDCQFLLDSEFRYQLTGELLRKIAQYNIARSHTQAPIGIVAMSCLDRLLNFSSASSEDFHQITEKEWHALRMPHPLLEQGGAGTEGYSGVKGGKLLRRSGNTHSAEYTESGTWLDLFKFLACGLLALVSLMGVVALIMNGGGVVIYVFALIAAVQFCTALLSKDNNNR